MKNVKNVLLLDFKKYLFLMIIVSTFLILAVYTVEAATLEVGSGYTYEKIQIAINDSTSRDTILVYPGTYTENIKVNKQVNITSVDGYLKTNVTALSSDDYVFAITVDNVTISGFNVSGATCNNKAGIYLDGVSNCTLTTNTAKNNIAGIYLNGASNNNIRDNTAKNNIFGIYLYVASNNNITSNKAENNCYGIYLYGDNKNNIISNKAENNSHGIYLDMASNNILTGNTAENNTDSAIRLRQSSNCTLTSNTVENNNCYGIYLSRSSSCTLTGNTADNNSRHGIRLRLSSNCTLTSNTAKNNAKNGIHLDESSNSTITNNMANNNNIGIGLDESSNNTINNNTAENNNYCGIYLWVSSNNIIFNNYFNNTYNAYFDGTNTFNIWNTTKTAGENIAGGSYLGGNYWLTPNSTGFSQINTTDNNDDGICDEKYNINGSGFFDYLPLLPVTPVKSTSSHKEATGHATVVKSTPENTAENKDNSNDSKKDSETNPETNPETISNPKEETGSIPGENKTNEVNEEPKNLTAEKKKSPGFTLLTGSGILVLAGILYRREK